LTKGDTEYHYRGIVMRLRSVLFLAVGLLLAGCACGCTSTPTVNPGTVQVVASTTVFADLVRSVAGSHATVTSLVPAGADVHTFSPTPAAIRAVSAAQLIVMNGLGLDDWVASTISAANANAPLLQLAADVPGFTPLAGDDGESYNPHLWMDVSYARAYVNEIADELESVDRPHAADYEANLAAEDAALASLDTWIRDQFASVPVADRQVVTFHDAFPYFARAYGLTIVGVAVQAPGQDPSAGEIAALITAIRNSGVRAVLAENQFPRKLADEIASETGVTVVANLYDDSLGDPPVTSYDALMRWDVGQIMGAL
jgi:ABC-type Zn uptake system ZnuABC Zn-binding protein ZnuA